MEIELKKTSTITEELPCGYTLTVEVDHLDEECPFDLTFGSEEMGWVSGADLNAIKKVFNKAISLHKTK